MEKADLCSIIVPTFNTRGFLQQTLEAVVRNTRWPYEVIVVENNSTDGTVEYLKNLDLEIDGQVIYNQINMGFGAANNQAAKLAKGSFLVFLNSDTIPTKGWLTAMMKVFEEEDAVGLVGCLNPKVQLITRDGKKAINEIKVGDYVLTHKNRFRKVTRIFNRKYKGEWTRIKFRNDKAKLIMATSEHPILVFRDKKLEWIKIGNVKKSDRIMAKATKCKVCNNPIPSWMQLCKYCNPAELEETKKKLKAYGETRRVPKRPKGSNFHLKHFKDDILPEMEKWRKKGYRTIPTSNFILMPDFIAIKNDKVMAVEVEKSKKPNYKKYDKQEIFDDVTWVLKHRKKPRINTPLKGFIPVKIEKIEHLYSTFRTKDYRTVYNCEVEGDNSYVVGKANVVMHNCKLLHPGTGLIQHAGVVEMRDGRPDHIYFKKHADYPPANTRKQYFAVTFACAVVPKGLFENIGGFDEGYWCGWEDVCFCQEVHKRGQRVYYEPKAVVYHYESRTEGRYKRESHNFNRYAEQYILNRTEFKKGNTAWKNRLKRGGDTT